MNDPERSCGKGEDRCNVCCQVYNIAFFKKPEGELCRWWAAGEGCVRYGTRPPVCCEYSCTYLEGEGREDERPDKVGFAAHIKTRTTLGPALVMMESIPGALESVAAVECIRRHLDKGKPVYTYSCTLCETIILPMHLARGKEQLERRYATRTDPPRILAEDEFQASLIV